MSDVQRVASSFRDPSGFLFRSSDGTLYRQINRVYEPHYRQLNESGLYQELIEHGLLVEHEEAPLDLRYSDDAAAVIRPRPIPFISHPYEWCFSQLYNAALLTLDIQQRALAKGMSLKDCSAYNVQFVGTHPVFIDTLSFEPFREGEPWIAYGQFCRHFLAPLALMAYRDAGLNSMLAQQLDGIPVELASRLLPLSTWAKLGLLFHVHLQGWIVTKYKRYELQEKSAPRAETTQTKSMTKTNMVALLDHLKSAVESLPAPHTDSLWSDYTATSTYSTAATQSKRQIVVEMIAHCAPKIVWDLGANTGAYSRLAADSGAYVVSVEGDPACVEANFRQCREKSTANVLPLRVDLANPSPTLGWAHEERNSLAERGPADLVLALALIHHLAIANNTPFDRVASFLRRLAPACIIEFVPKIDSQVQRLLASREDIFDNYTEQAFDEAFSKYFTVVDRQRIAETERILFLMRSTP